MASLYMLLVTLLVTIYVTVVGESPSSVTAVSAWPSEILTAHHLPSYHQVGAGGVAIPKQYFRPLKHQSLRSEQRLDSCTYSKRLACRDRIISQNKWSLWSRKCRQ
ncbi:hypothetical protein V1522DRAFT_418057 [Lipomyces starkeyi]